MTALILTVVSLVLGGLSLWFINVAGAGIGSVGPLKALILPFCVFSLAWGLILFGVWGLWAWVSSLFGGN